MSDLPDKIARLIQGLLDAAQEDDGKKLWSPKTIGTREALEAAIEDAIDDAHAAAESSLSSALRERDEARAEAQRIAQEGLDAIESARRRWRDAGDGERRAMKLALENSDRAEAAEAESASLRAEVARLAEQHRALWWMHAWVRYTVAAWSRVSRDTPWPPTGWARWQRAHARYGAALSSSPQDHKAGNEEGSNG